MSDGAAAPAGWYPDPHGQPVLRWWDGVNWNEQTQAAAQPGMAAQPAMPYWQAPAAVQPRSSNVYSTIAIVLGCIAFLFLPIILGPAGLILGAIGKSKGESRAAVAMAISAAGMVIGMILSFVVFRALVR